jgi:hypothetical protein
MDPDRKDFLLKMYGSCWDNVTRAEDSLWKVFAAYTALFAGLGLTIEHIGTFGFLFIMTIFSFAGIVSSLIANSWFVRNMGIISNIEKEFLKFDADEVIPKSWTLGKVPFLNVENWWTIVALFSAILIAIHVVLLSTVSEADLPKQILLDVFGGIFVGFYWIVLQRNHDKFINSAPGKTIS